MNYYQDLKFTPWRQIRPGNDYDDEGTYVARARLPASATKAQRKRMAREVANSMSRSNCRHDYDCCGCILRSVYARVDNRTLRLTMRVGRNY